MKNTHRINWLECKTIEEMHSRIFTSSSDGSASVCHHDKLNKVLQKIKGRYQHSDSKVCKVDIATSYLTEIVSDRPFRIGNETMAIACCETFLALKGHGEIIALDDDTMEILIDAVQDGVDTNQLSQIICRELE